MMREKKIFLSSIYKLLDLLITFISFITAIATKKLIFHTSNFGFSNETILVLLIIIIWYIVFSSFINYDLIEDISLYGIFNNIIKTVLICNIILTAFFYLLKIENVSRFVMIFFIVYNIILLCLGKYVIIKVNKKLRNNGDSKKHVIIIGSKGRAIELIEGIEEKTPDLYTIIGCLDTDTDTTGNIVTNGYKIIGAVQDLQKHLIENIVDEIIFAMPLKKIECVDKYIAMAEDMGVHVRIIPDWQLHYLMYEPDIATIKFKSIAGIPSMTLHMTTPNEGALLLKTLFDFISSLLIIIIGSPLFIVISTMIKISSSGPVFFKQERLGLHGRKFQVYKFRTMVENAEYLKESLKDKNESDGPVFKIKNDPRIIPYIGTFLRKTNLDELPQLINIIKGEMSLVGPRPPITSEVNEYEIWQRRRLSMKPGITCLWQISKNRNDLSFEQWMKLDLHYIDSWSIILDFKILILTFNTVFMRSGR